MIRGHFGKGAPDGSDGARKNTKESAFLCDFHVAQDESHVSNKTDGDVDSAPCTIKSTMTHSSHVSSESSDPNRDQNDRYEDIVQGGYPVGREGTRIVPMKTIDVHETLLGFEMARTFAL